MRLYIQVTGFKWGRQTAPTTVTAATLSQTVEYTLDELSTKKVHQYSIREMGPLVRFECVHVCVCLSVWVISCVLVLTGLLWGYWQEVKNYVCPKHKLCRRSILLSDVEQESLSCILIHTLLTMFLCVRACALVCLCVCVSWSVNPNGCILIIWVISES